MKKFRILGVALIAIFAVSLAVVSMASAAVTFLLAEWLSAGAKITTAQATDAESSELELVALNGGNIKVVSKVLCSGILLGTVGPGSEGTVTELLSLASAAISKTALVNPFLACTGDQNCTEPEVWATGLPWKTELELMIEGTETFFANLITTPAGYYVKCLVLGVTFSEECVSAATSIETANEAGGVVDQKFSDAFQVLSELKLATCTPGGVETGEVNGLGTLLLTSGAALTASSE